MDTLAAWVKNAYRPKLGRPLSDEEAAELAMHLRRFAAFLIDCAKDPRFNADILMTYLVNPWTAVYVGYSDGYENLPLAPITSPPPSRADLPLTSVGRQVFVKLSYLFRY